MLVLAKMAGIVAMAGLISAFMKAIRSAKTAYGVQATKKAEIIVKIIPATLDSAFVTRPWILTFWNKPI